MANLYGWFKDTALPLWWTDGADRVRGGFHEAIRHDGTPVVSNRRAHVASRQVYVYATAAKAGLPGPWREAAAHGMAFITSRFLRPDGVMRSVLTPEGAPLGDEVKLYGQAFCLFAFAAAAAIDLERDAQMDRSQRLLRALRSDWVLPTGGFIEYEPHAYQANPHMHLFEASLALEEVSSAPEWPELADEIAGMALTRFIDPVSGVLRELFTADWRPAPGDDGRWIEPGHMFEWSWLLMRWAVLRGRDDAATAARRLFDIADAHGVDRARGVCIDGLHDDLTIASARARLWPQTERIKAAAILAQHAATPAERERFLSEARLAAKGLQLYLQTEIPGLWYDKLGADGVMLDEPAPASSFYHIACAILDADARGCRL